jgi:hypothetical protein
VPLELDRSQFLRRAPPPQPGKSSAAYDPAMHFSNIVAQLQGIEKWAPNPPDIVDLVRRHADKHLVTPAEITPQFTIKMLKQCNHKTMYKHYVKIAFLASGLPPPALSMQQADDLATDFQLVLRVWPVVRADMRAVGRTQRINFPSYKFVAFKLCEHRGYDHICRVCLLPCIPEKIAALNRMWSMICARTGIAFIDTPLEHGHHK